MAVLTSGDVTLDFSADINTYFSSLKDVIDSLDRDQINNVVEMLIHCHQREGFIYIFGNGGSASTASHFVNDFNKLVSEHLPVKFRFCCLNDNIPTMMSIANDIGYDQIFKCQLENYLTDNDLVIAISGSGNSKNVIKAVEYANYRGAETVGLVGFDGGKLKKIAKQSILVPVYDMQQVEDVHVILNHLMVKIVKNYLEKQLQKSMSLRKSYIFG